MERSSKIRKTMNNHSDENDTRQQQQIMATDGGNSTDDELMNELLEDVEDLNGPTTEVLADYELDCYPYTFTPLLLFSPSSYFDKGYSNYNSVAHFFSSCIPQSINMLDNTKVLYDRKNMVYEVLMDHVIKNEMLVTCCIDAHFTALQVLPGGLSKKGGGALYYDPLKPRLLRVTGEAFRLLLAFLLLKCNYGDSQHIQDNTDHYTGVAASSTRRMIYKLWRKINLLTDASSVDAITWGRAPLNMNGKYVLINDKANTQLMSTQLSSNTCYFQTYLFAVLCKVGELSMAPGDKIVNVKHVDKVEEVTAKMAQFLLEFFVETKRQSSNDDADGDASAAATTRVLRPLTNSNFVLDFYRYRTAPYFKTMMDYLQHLQQRNIPNYEDQYEDVINYYRQTKLLHKYSKFSLSGAMSSAPNTKSLQPVSGTDDGGRKLARSDYFKYRAANFMFGFNSNIMMTLGSFCEFNALRKNQLLRFSNEIAAFSGCTVAVQKAKKATKYRDYYFMPQFEVGQQELVDIHHYTYLIDLCAMTSPDSSLQDRIHATNEFLVDHIFMSTNKRHNYEKFLSAKEFRKSKKTFKMFRDIFMSADYHHNFVGLGFPDINPKEKEINSLTQTVFYNGELMRQQAHRQEFEFEKECINQMARSTVRKYLNVFDENTDMDQKYQVIVKIGHGYTYTKYNTLIHFLNVAECYWRNPDLSNVQVFGKDIRALLAVSCQKIFFQEGHSGFYHYGPFENGGSAYRQERDLALATSVGHALPGVSRSKRGNTNNMMVTDRVFEFDYLKKMLGGIFGRVEGTRFKSDNEVINLCLLSLMLDFGLYEQHVGLLNLPFLNELQHKTDTRELQVEVANLIYEFDRKNTTDAVTRSRVEELLFEVSYKFMINKDFPVHSRQFKLIRELNGDPDYQSYVLLVKIYMSLCQINESVEVDYYKVHCDEEFRIIIPNNFSKLTSEYLGEVTRRYTFSERDGIMLYDDLPVFDLRPHQPEINLYKIRFDSKTAVQSMVKYIEIANSFHVLDNTKEQYLVFMANNVLMVEVVDSDTTIHINKNPVDMATIYFNDAISFIPCFKYADSEDVVLFTSRNINYLVDQGGQFCTDYYGMRHELIECIKSEEGFVDLNDEHVFKQYRLSELLTESKTVIYFPDYLLQVSDRTHLINLLDFALHIRNVSFFILVLFSLRRCSVALQFMEKENDVIKITGPWKEAILYVLNRAPGSAHYNPIFEKQFFDLNQYKNKPLDDFIDILCENFTKYQRFIDGQYQIIPTDKQKAFVKRIICAEECFHFSEVGSGKTKVIMPLLCQAFLSNNVEVHNHLSRGGKRKNVLVILVPEHLVSDAKTQVYRYCLNLNFREEYRVYDDIFALMHKNVQLGGGSGGFAGPREPAHMKHIFVTSFNLFKKALTYDVVCSKVFPCREQILVVADEVDDFLDRNKLVFNICSNKNNAFDRTTLDCFFEVCRAAYLKEGSPPDVANESRNPEYWKHLFMKFGAINNEIQDASRSINKSFGIFNEYTLRHCTTNIVHDIEGYKSLIARPYESVNRAMPGSYFSDVERTIFLTYVILTEDIEKYDELFQSERKFISFDYWNEYFLHHLEFDDLVYGHEKLSEIVEKHPATKDGLTRYLYEIILRRMEIRDKSRSVSSIDVIFNFDCIGFTGTPFLDNYPTFDYIRHERQDNIPDLIDRRFYAYTTDNLPVSEFEARFSMFQGQNNNVMVEYVSSDFIGDYTDEMGILEAIFEREQQSIGDSSFNAIVDLCGIFKRSTIHDVRNLLLKHFGEDHFHFIYHIDQTDNSDRVLYLKSENDIQYDEEFYKHLCREYGPELRDRIFFFVDNRNVIGKDIPFQLVYQRHFGQPLFTKNVILAHDVDDFSKIWQAMGRSRTMNHTQFSIYKSGLNDKGIQPGLHDIKKQDLTRHLYIHNCDRKIAGNISSIYLTLIALFNLSQRSFYYRDEIVNVFLEKMQKTIAKKVAKHEQELARSVLGNPVTAQIFAHILMGKFKRSADPAVAAENLTEEKIGDLLQHIVKQKFEQRLPSLDIFDGIIGFLSGEQKSLMEISYTKQQQKQKQKQQNKNQDSDAMGVFDKRNQITLSFKSDNYFKDTLMPLEDQAKILMNLPVSVPILKATYSFDGQDHVINVYPTVQFLYSHHILGGYISAEVQNVIQSFRNSSEFYARFFEAVKNRSTEESQNLNSGSSSKHGDDAAAELAIKVPLNAIRQNPEYSLAALSEGVYVIGMKDQFNIHDMQSMYALHSHIQYISDDMGFVLFDKTGSKQVDSFGPYFIEQYILMEVLSKQEIAQNVMDYFCNHRALLQKGLDSYDEAQGKGFICWRFLINETAKQAAAATELMEF